MSQDKNPPNNVDKKKKITKTKNALTVTKIAGKVVGFAGAVLKKLPGDIVQLVGNAAELASTIGEDKMSKKLNELEAQEKKEKED
mgnify:CR=1 FL=1